MCQVAQLRVAAQTPNGAAGQIELTIGLTNVSPTACTLYGYPGLQLLDGNGAPLPTSVVRGGTTFGPTAANQPPAQVTLAPQATAAFTLHYEDVPVGTETTCPVSAEVEVTPPGNVGHTAIALAIAPCGGGTVHVSPVYPSS